MEKIKGYVKGYKYFLRKTFGLLKIFSYNFKRQRRPRSIMFSN